MKRKNRGDLTVGDLKRILEGLKDDTRVRITVDEPTTYVQLVNSRFEGDKPYNVHPMEKSITLYGREGWDADLKPSECHVNDESELLALRASRKAS